MDNVIFKRGTSSRFEQITKDSNTLYFLTDTHEVLLGSERYGFGKDTSIAISGSGDAVVSASYDHSTKTLTLTLGNAGSLQSVKDAISEACRAYVKSIQSDVNSAIYIDNSDTQNQKIGIKFASGQSGSNVEFHQSSDGLWGHVDIPEYSIRGVKAGDKILSVDSQYLMSTLSITTEKINDILYIVLKGIDGQEISKFDASDFVKAGVLESASIEYRTIQGVIHPILVLKFKIAGGSTQTVECDLLGLIDVYKAASDGGLKLNSNNEFYIDNDVTACAKLNDDLTVHFGDTLTLNTVGYTKKGLVNSKSTFQITLPGLSGTIGSSENTKVLTYASISEDGELSGNSLDIVTQVSESSTDSQIPTAKAAYSNAKELTDNVKTESIEESVEASVSAVESELEEAMETAVETAKPKWTEAQ